MEIEYIKSLLSAEGYIANLDKDGDIIFKAQGKYIYISLQEGDENYIRIFLDSHVSIDTTSEYELLKILNKTSKKYKCVKCTFLYNNQNLFYFRTSIECFNNNEIFKQSFLRYIDIVTSSAYEIGQKLNEDN